MELNNQQLEKVQNSFVQDLLNHISKEDYISLVRVFILDTQNLLETIGFSHYSKDSKNVVRAVHSLKGNASSLGYYHLSQYAANFEELLKSHSQELNSDIFEEFNESVRNALVNLELFNN